MMTERVHDLSELTVSWILAKLHLLCGDHVSKLEEGA